jgi:hypothetical protein
MAKRDTTIYDVYLSHAMGDASIASEVAYACLRNGLRVFQVPEPPTEELGSLMKEAIADCWALILIVPQSGPTNQQIIEFGAAWGWDKPIYAITADSSTTRLPDYLSRVPLFPIGRLDEVIRAVELIGRQLDDEDRAVLVELYGKIGMPLDVLSLELEQLRTLAREFNRTRRKKLSDDRLLSELFRLRKQGKLPRPRPEKRARSRSHPA